MNWRTLVRLSHAMPMTLLCAAAIMVILVGFTILLVMWAGTAPQG